MRFTPEGGKQFAVDERKWELPANELALQYRQLWIVEDVCQSMKSPRATRPAFHKCDETSRRSQFARSRT